MTMRMKRILFVGSQKKRLFRFRILLLLMALVGCRLIIYQHKYFTNTTSNNNTSWWRYRDDEINWTSLLKIVSSPSPSPSREDFIVNIVTDTDFNIPTDTKTTSKINGGGGGDATATATATATNPTTDTKTNTSSLSVGHNTSLMSSSDTPTNSTLLRYQDDGRISLKDVSSSPATNVNTTDTNKSKVNAAAAAAAAAADNTTNATTDTKRNNNTNTTGKFNMTTAAFATNSSETIVNIAAAAGYDTSFVNSSDVPTTIAANASIDATTNTTGTIKKNKTSRFHINFPLANAHIINGRNSDSSNSTTDCKEERQRIIQRAKSWLDFGNVTYTAKLYINGYRQQCSGYVSMSWDVGQNYTYNNTLRCYNLESKNISYEITKDELRMGDAMVCNSHKYDPWKFKERKKGQQKGGHCLIFERWTNSNKTHYIGWELCGDNRCHDVTRRIIPYPYFYKVNCWRPMRKYNLC